MSTETIQPIDTFIGTVLHGDKRGRTIGYPTVNLELDHDTRDGVYVSRVKVEGEWMPSMTSVGQAKTFNRKESANPFLQAAEERQIHVEFNTPLGPIEHIHGDKESLDLVFQNLIDNAIKYTPKGGAVSVSFRPQGDYVLVDVSDTGYGIPETEHDRIFTKFYRGTNILTVQADGSGLGLFLVKEVITQHGGDVSFQSTPGVGTTFTIALPISGPSDKHPGHHSMEGVDPQILTSNVREAIDESVQEGKKRLQQG